MAYATAMLGYALSQERRKNIMNKAKKKKNDINIVEKLTSLSRISNKKYSVFG